MGWPVLRCDNTQKSQLFKLNNGKLSADLLILIQATDF